jgi:hypothetical protein
MNHNPPTPGRCGAGAQQPAAGGQMSVVTALGASCIGRPFARTVGV